MKDENPATLIGTVVFIRKNISSKSEGTYPVLYQNKDQSTPILMREDNPFENNAIVPFDGKLVKITGTMGRGGVFLVSEICPITRELEYPATETSTLDNDLQNKN